MNNKRSDDRKKTTGSLIQDLRKAAEVSQWDLANKVNISQAKLSLFESGHRELDSDELTRVLDALYSVISENWQHFREKRQLCAAADAWIAYVCDGLSEEAKMEMHLLRGWPNEFSENLARRQNSGPTVGEHGMINMIRRVALRRRIDDLEQELAKLKSRLAEL